MNTPDPLETQLKASATAQLAKTAKWFASGNLYPFGIGAGSAVVVVKVLHLLGLMKML
jgi:hypothetical protein